jgi:hypothetical protein
MNIVLHVKYPLLLSVFNEIWIFSAYFRKIFVYQISWKSAKWKPSCATNMTKLTVAFRNYANASKIASTAESVASISLSYQIRGWEKRLIARNEPPEYIIHRGLLWTWWWTFVCCTNNRLLMRSEPVAVVIIKITVLWGVTPCILTDNIFLPKQVCQTTRCHIFKEILDD